MLMRARIRGEVQLTFLSCSKKPALGMMPSS